MTSPQIYRSRTDPGEAEFATVSLTFPTGGWQLNYNTNRFYCFIPGNNNIVDENGTRVCEGVMNSTAALTNKGVSIMVDVYESGGGHSATNSMSSFVQFRNQVAGGVDV